MSKRRAVWIASNFILNGWGMGASLWQAVPGAWDFWFYVGLFPLFAACFGFWISVLLSDLAEPA